VTRSLKRREKKDRGSLTILLLPQVTGDQKWEEGREKL
jgi:hypothetical protein